jgi:hypothetical protein
MEADMRDWLRSKPDFKNIQLPIRERNAAITTICNSTYMLKTGQFPPWAIMVELFHKMSKILVIQKAVEYSDFQRLCIECNIWC